MVSRCVLLWICSLSSVLLYQNTTRQALGYEVYPFSLSSIAFKYVLVELVVTGHTETLLIGNYQSPPYAYIDTSGNLQLGSQYADLPGYALKKRYNSLQLPTSSQSIDSTVYLGVMTPIRTAEGLNMQLTATGHGKCHT